MIEGSNKVPMKCLTQEEVALLNVTHILASTCQICEMWWHMSLWHTLFYIFTVLNSVFHVHFPT